MVRLPTRSADSGNLVCPARCNDDNDDDDDDDDDEAMMLMIESAIADDMNPTFST
jgi:hypothetical protein